MELLEKLWKEYQKNLQKVTAQSLGLSLLQQQSKKVQKSKRREKNALGQAKRSIENANTGLEKSVQGQFGKKVTDVLDESNYRQFVIDVNLFLIKRKSPQPFDILRIVEDSFFNKNQQHLLKLFVDNVYHSQIYIFL